MNDTDIAIIGSGASGTHCLLQVLRQLSGNTSPVRIVVIDRDSQFHSGIPYGHRSGPSSLLITRLADFLSESELTHFTNWLNDKRDAILATPKLDRDWLDRHGDDIRRGRWEDLYLPRRLYGRYLRSRAEAAIAQARRENIAEVEYITAEITGVVPQADGSSLLIGTRRPRTAREGSRFEMRAVSSVLSIGSPPVKRLDVRTTAGQAPPSGRTRDQEPGQVPDLAQGYVADIHAPTIEDTLDRVRDRLLHTASAERRILVVGGNADALEFVLASDSLRRETGAELTVLATRGRPYYWRHARPGEVPEIGSVQELLDAIDTGLPPRAEEFFRAVEQDVTDSIAHGSDKATISAIMAAVGRVIGSMDEPERAEMAGAYGLRISNLLRQAGGDAVDLLDAATGDSVLTFERGRFTSAVLAEGLFTVTATQPSADGMEAVPLTLKDRYAVIINATGFEPVEETRSPLLHSLLTSGTASASCSGAGLATDCRFRASPGIYVLGPLLSGFNHDGVVVWHAESVNRIIHLAAQLAPGLVEDTLRRRQTLTPSASLSPRASVSRAG